MQKKNFVFSFAIPLICASLQCTLLDNAYADKSVDAGLVLYDKYLSHSLFAIDVIDDNVEDIAGVNLADGLKELVMEGVVVVDLVVGHHVEGNCALLLQIEVAMHLLDMRVALQESHYALLQICFHTVVTNGIDAHRDDDVVFVVEQFGNGSREPVDAVGRHGFGHADMK